MNLKNFRILMLIAFYCLFYNQVNAQNSPQLNFNQYEPQYCEGTIPHIYNTLSSSKAREAINRIKTTSNSKRKEKRQEIDHAIEASFLEDQMLTSGQVLFGDPMTKYVESVAKEVLKENTALFGQLQFFVLKSHIPNAYATHNGLIFVTIGLLARLENESQLAVILAHEIQHFVKKHSLKQYKEISTVISSSRGNNSDIESKLKRLYRFSKNQEVEADKLGFELIKQSKYDLSEGIYVFEMLKYTEFPFLETPMSIDSFATENYQFPQTLREAIQKRISAAETNDAKVKSEEATDEENSTHPSLDARIADLRIMISQAGATGTQKFIVSETNFNTIQKISRYELLLLYLRRADFGCSFYLSKILELLYGKGNFLTRVKIMSINGLLVHKLNNKSLNNFGCNVDENKGDWRPISAAFFEMENKEFAAFAAKIAWESYLQFPNDAFIKNLRDDIFTRMQLKSKMILTDFLDFKPDPKLASSPTNPETGTLKDKVEVVLPAPETTKNTSTKTQSKTDKNNKSTTDKQTTPTKNVSVAVDTVKPKSALKNPRSRINRSGKSSDGVSLAYYYGSLYDFEDQNQLSSYLSSIKQVISSTDVSSEETDSDEPRKSKKKKVTSVDNNDDYLSPNRDVNGAVVFEPKVSQTRIEFGTSKRDFLLEEKSKFKILALWKELSRSSRIKISLVNNSVSKGLNTDDLNQYARLNDWLTERVNNDTASMKLFYSQFIEETMKEYNTKYIVWSKYKITDQYHSKNIFSLYYAFICYPVVPILMYQGLMYQPIFDEFMVVYNTESGKIEKTVSGSYDHYVREDFLKSHIYNFIYEIRHLPKKEKN